MRFRQILRQNERIHLYEIGAVSKNSFKDNHVSGKEHDFLTSFQYIMS